MTRGIMGVAAAVALLGGGFARPMPQATGDWDDEESRLKREAAVAASRREHEALRESAEQRARERIQKVRDAEARKQDDWQKLRAGIDPTNGKKLSRQQRRFLERRNFPFLEPPK